MTLLETLQKRRSIRTYTDEPIAEDKLTTILQAGMLSASGKAIYPWELILVKDKATLQQMSECRGASSKMLAGADAAIVVLANEDLSDVWIEDCSIVMANMHLMADSLGVGSCWLQGRLREAPDGTSTESYLRNILGYPENFKLEAILSLGMPENQPPRHELSDLPMEKVHKEKF